MIRGDAAGILKTVKSYVSAEHGDIRAGVESALADGLRLENITTRMGNIATSRWRNSFAYGGRGELAAAMANALAMARNRAWFSVRPEAKDGGIGPLTRGAQIEGEEVVIVDTVTDTGVDLLHTVQDVQDIAGARVLAVLPLVDMDSGAAVLFKENVPEVEYNPILMAKDILPKRRTRR